MSTTSQRELATSNTDWYAIIPGQRNKMSYTVHCKKSTYGKCSAHTKDSNACKRVSGPDSKQWYKYQYLCLRNLVDPRSESLNYPITTPFTSPWKAPWDKFHIPIYLFQPNWPVWCMFWGTFFKSSKSWGIFQKNRFLGSIFGVFSCSAAISEPICMKFWLPG